MTNLASDIAAYLATAANTQALTSGRVYWPFATSEPSMPYACVRLVSWRRLAIDMDGARAPRDFEVEVLCFADSQADAWALANAVLTDLDNRTGVTGGTTIKHCFCATAADVVEEALFARGVSAVALSFAVKA